MRSIEWCHFQWPRWTLNPVSWSRHLWSRISQKLCLRDTVTI